MLAPPGYAKTTSTPCRASDSTRTSAPVIGVEEVLVSVWRSSMAATANPLSRKFVESGSVGCFSRQYHSTTSVYLATILLTTDGPTSDWTNRNLGRFETSKPPPKALIAQARSRALRVTHVLSVDEIENNIRSPGPKDRDFVFLRP